METTDCRELMRYFESITDRERAARWTLWRVDGVGFRRVVRLLEQTEGRVERLFEVEPATRTHLLERAGIGGKVAGRIMEALAECDPLAAFERELESLPPETTIHHLGESSYPRRLTSLEAPPVFVYVRGSLKWLDMVSTVAMVGSRDATVEQTRRARTIASELAEEGIAVVSGGARGIDASSHRGCLDAKMPTLAVLAGGVDRPTPRQNAPLFERITESGSAIVSEYPLGVRPRRYHYHRRNDLIAALGDATLVVRAGRKSGTLITAEAAKKLDRPLCVLPGGLDEPLVEGCLELLVEGAQCVRGARDIIERALNRQSRRANPAQASLLAAPDGAEKSVREPPPGEPHMPSSIDLSRGAKEVFEVIATLADAARGADIHRDEIGRRVDWKAGRLDQALLELELAGLVSKCAGANAFRLS